MFSEAFYDAYMNEPAHIFRRVFKNYINGSHEVRAVLNDTFISLCGWGFENLLNESDSLFRLHELGNDETEE